MVYLFRRPVPVLFACNIICVELVGPDCLWLSCGGSKRGGSALAMRTRLQSKSRNLEIRGSDPEATTLFYHAPS